MLFIRSENGTFFKSEEAAPENREYVLGRTGHNARDTISDSAVGGDISP